MFRRTLVIFSSLVFAFAILFASVLKTASIKYVFSEEVGKPNSSPEKVEINYALPYPGRIYPDNPLWPLKALRDKIWLFLTTNTSRKAELNLLFADKRLAMSKTLFEKDKPEIAFSTLTKAEKYLEEACNLEERSRRKGTETAEMLKRLSMAALKHRQMIEEILMIAPEDARPEIIKTQNYSKDSFKRVRDALQEGGLPAPQNPFDST